MDYHDAVVVEGPGNLWPPFPLEPLPDSSEFGLGFTHRVAPPMGCYLKGKTEVVLKGCAGGEGVTSPFVGANHEGINPFADSKAA